MSVRFESECSLWMPVVCGVFRLSILSIPSSVDFGVWSDSSLRMREDREDSCGMMFLRLSKSLFLVFPLRTLQGSLVVFATISAFSEHLTPRPLGPLSGRNDSSCVSLHGLRVANPHKPFGNQAPHTFGCHFEVALLQFSWGIA